MKESNMPKADFLMSIIFMVFGTTIFLISLHMPRFEEFDANPYSVPGIVPGFLGFVIAALGLVLFIRSIIKKGYRWGLTAGGVKDWFRDDGTHRLFITLAFCLVYSLVFIGWLPYPIGTVLFIFGFIVAFEYQKGIPFRHQGKMFLFAGIISVVSGLSIWAVFRFLFLVNLP